MSSGTPVDLKTETTGKTALHVACQFAQLNVVKILLEFGAEQEARTFHGRTPLHLSAAQGHLEVVQHLLTCGADVSALTPEGESARDLARKYSYTAVEYILSQK